MGFFGRFRKPDSRGEKPPQPRQEQEMVFEEVKERVEDFTYREDPVEQRAGQILSLEEALEQAQDELKEGRGDRRGVMVKEVLLAKARYEQARENERSGRGRQGEADRLLEDWQTLQDALDDLRSQQIDNARGRIAGLYEDDIDAETEAQMRRHA